VRWVLSYTGPGSQWRTQGMVRRSRRHESAVLVQRGTEPADEGHRLGACPGTGTQAAAELLLDRIQKNAQGTVERLAVVLGMDRRRLMLGVGFALSRRC